MDEVLEEQSRGESDYIASLRAAFRALWLSLMSYDQAFEVMQVSIRRGFERAWAEGAKECGILPEEFTPAERIELETLIFGQFNYVNGVLEFIEANSKANGGAWATVNARVPLWANKYREAKSKAASYACANKKKMFVLGATEEHCRSCNTLNGRVYRYEVYRLNGAIPPSSKFECKGFRCLCTLVDTDARITPGPFPKGLLT